MLGLARISGGILVPAAALQLVFVVVSAARGKTAMVVVGGVVGVFLFFVGAVLFHVARSAAARTSQPPDGSDLGEAGKGDAGGDE